MASSTIAFSQESDDNFAEFLFVQNAESVSLNQGVLRLQGINANTLYFSDRPKRIVGHVTTEAFVDHWGTGDDSFKSDPPNAVLSILGQSQPRNIVVVLRNPRLGGDNLVYEVTVLEGASAAKGEAAALFIDTIGRPLTPLSYAGVARRHERRMVRWECAADDEKTVTSRRGIEDCDHINY